MVLYSTISIADNHKYPEIVTDAIKICHEFEDGYISRRTRDEEIDILRNKYYEEGKESGEYNNGKRC